MPLIFISLNTEFNVKMSAHGYPAHTLHIDKYQPVRKTYYVSPANSSGDMYGGIDRPLSEIIFPNIQRRVHTAIKSLNRLNNSGEYYLPIGSSIILDSDTPLSSLVVAPTMLRPQNVAHTQNAYYSTMAVLYNVLINRGEKLADVDIIFTAMCCGCGGMNVDEAINQMIRGINDYTEYDAQRLSPMIIIAEPNLDEQPRSRLSPFQIDNDDSGFGFMM